MRDDPLDLLEVGHSAYEWLRGWGVGPPGLDGVSVDIGLPHAPTVELAGRCDLLEAPWCVAFVLVLRLSPAFDAITGHRFYLGELDQGTPRRPTRRFKGLLADSSLASFVRSTTWWFTDHDGEVDPRYSLRPWSSCEACASLVFSDMVRDGLCPEFACRYLRGPGCRHEFMAGRCTKCFWDGSEGP